MDDKWNILDHSKVFVKWSATPSVSRRYDGFDNMKSNEREWFFVKLLTTQTEQNCQPQY